MSGTLTGLPSPGYSQLYQYMSCWAGLPSASLTHPLQNHAAFSDEHCASDNVRSYLETTEKLEDDLYRILEVPGPLLKQAVDEGERLKIWFWKYKGDFDWMAAGARADFVLDDLFQLHTAITHTRSRVDRWNHNSNQSRSRPLGLNNHIDWLHGTIHSRHLLAETALSDSQQGSLRIFFSTEQRDSLKVLSSREAIRTYLRVPV